MVRVIVFFSLLFVAFSCNKKEVEPKEDKTDTIPAYNSSVAYELQDIKYGNHPQQILDAYLPANRTSNTKVFVLIHGGGWISGSKADISHFYEVLKQTYPQCAIINIGYRLASVESPGYPKQIEDIKSAIKFMQHPNFSISNEYFLFGSSAGGHLALLYGYAFDEFQEVKGICNTVGPTDFTDPSYTDNPDYEYGLINFVGNYTYTQNPELYKEVSPAWQVKAYSPPTISFFGDADLLTPSTQMNRLHDKLDAFGVVNEKTLYQGEGHGDWNTTNSDDYRNKINQFLLTYFL